MTAVYCYRDDCKHRSKRKSQKINKAGEPMYRCTKNQIIITDAYLGEYADEEVCQCLNFEKIEDEEYEE